MFSPRTGSTTRQTDAGAVSGYGSAGEIVEAHGGRIWIETGDAGTTVTFTLPSAEGDG